MQRPADKCVTQVTTKAVVTTASASATFCSRFDATCGTDYKWESCATEFSKLAAGSGTGQANTQACRVYHLKLAEASAQSAKAHCPHASKAGTGQCVDVAETTGTLCVLNHARESVS